MTREESIHAMQTPGIARSALSRVFGLRGKGDWGTCEKAGYTGKKFLIVDPTTQPLIPTAPGDPGILISPPGDLSQDDDKSFQVFSRTPDNVFRYYGEYTKVSGFEIEIGWEDISPKVSFQNFTTYQDTTLRFIMQCRDTWLKRITTSSVHRDLRTRIKYWNTYNKQPSATELLAFQQSHPHVKLAYKDVSAVFGANQEVSLIYCRCCKW